MTTGHSVETQEFLTKEPIALSSYALTCVALTNATPDACLPNRCLVLVLPGDVLLLLCGGILITSINILLVVFALS